MAPNLHLDEPHVGSAASRLNQLRAGVLGANDGIVSVAGIVVGVAAASTDRGPILTAGLAGLAAGALSMAVGEYVSVSTQRDTELALLEKERQELQEYPAEELAELTEIYQAKGLCEETARQVAVELTAHNAFVAHAHAELHIDPNSLTRPWSAALSSALSFLAGAVLPLVAVLVPSASQRIPFTMIAVTVALILTGLISAALGRANRTTAVLRVTIGGLAAMGVTYAIGTLVGHVLT